MRTLTGIITRYPHTVNENTRVKTETVTVEFDESFLSRNLRGARVIIEVPDTTESLLREVWDNLKQNPTRYVSADIVDLRRRIAKHFGEEI